MIDWLLERFADLHALVFEGIVQPGMRAFGLAGYVEIAFEGTEIFLIGVIEVLLLALLLSALEGWRPVQKIGDHRGSDSERRTDVIYTLLNRLGIVPLLIFVSLQPLVDALDGWLRLHDVIPPKLEDWWPTLHALPLASFFLYLLILDFIAYWLHRAQHRSAAWWSLHVLHHSQRDMTFWTDDRNHLLDDVLRSVILAAVALMIGVAPQQFVVLIVVSRVVESLAHANVRLSFGWLGERMLVSPHFHRLHHAMGVGHEGVYRGCNFAVLFPVWDVLFGTANFERDFPATGVRDQLDGVSYGRGFWRQQWSGIVRLWNSLKST